MSAGSGFEKTFKELVKAQGAGADPMRTAQAVVMGMTGPERTALNSSLKSMNIKNGKELQSTLAAWKHEALLSERSVTMPQRQRLWVEFTRG
jgi:hypothetical protein